MRAICLGAELPYVPRADRGLPPEEQTTFLLRPLSMREVLLLGASAETGTPFAVNLRTLAIGLRGWRNLRRPDGAQVEFRREAAAADDAQPYLDVLDDPVVRELAGAIVDCAGVARADAGKSSSPSGGPAAGSAPSATPA